MAVRFRPRSLPPAKAQTLRRGFFVPRSGKSNDSWGEPERKIRRPRKRKAKPETPEQRQSDYSPVAKAMVQAAKQAALGYPNQKDASDAQWEVLGRMIGAESRSDLIRFVEFANMIPTGFGTLSRWGKYDRPSPGHGGPPIFLSRRYWIVAIDLARSGLCENGSMEDLLDEMSGGDCAPPLIDLFADLPPVSR